MLVGISPPNDPIHPAIHYVSQLVYYEIIGIPASPKRYIPKNDNKILEVLLVLAQPIFFMILLFMLETL